MSRQAGLNPQHRRPVAPGFLALIIIVIGCDLDVLVPPVKNVRELVISCGHDAPVRGVADLGSFAAAGELPTCDQIAWFEGEWKRLIHELSEDDSSVRYVDRNAATYGREYSLVNGRIIGVFKFLDTPVLPKQPLSGAGYYMGVDLFVMSAIPFDRVTRINFGRRFIDLGPLHDVGCHLLDRGGAR